MKFLTLGLFSMLFSLLLMASILDRVQRLDAVIFIGGLAPLVAGTLGWILGFPNQYSPVLEFATVILTFSGLVLMVGSWAVFLNRTVVARFRGRIAGVLISVAFVFYSVFLFFSMSPYVGGSSTTPIAEIVCLVSLFVSVSFRPWNFDQVALAVRGKASRYLVPLAFVMAAHFLWYAATKATLAQAMEPLSHNHSLVFLSGIEGLDFIVLATGVLIGGFIADLLDRKEALRAGILGMGLLTIFGPAFYGYNIVGVAESFYIFALPLLIFERLVEGLLMGSTLLLIWGEVGSPKTKARRLAAVWMLYLGYAILFWFLEIGAIEFAPSQATSRIAEQTSILLAFISLYFMGRVPDVVSREIEMEDLELRFDEERVEEAVDNYLDDRDFESIRQQLDIIDAASDVSDADLEDMLGGKVAKILPLRRVHGVGEKMEHRLKREGYESAAQLAGERADRLAQKVEGLNEKGAMKIISAARELVEGKLNS
ncbi:MAG: helix-hairpin-helix domain-containing protein [Promethearchaeati archaeon]